MANLKVALYRYCRTEIGWRRCCVDRGHKGRGWDERIKVPAGQKTSSEVDLLKFCNALRKRGCAERTVQNYHSASRTQPALANLLPIFRDAS
jgi:hypothetical protein